MNMKKCTIPLVLIVMSLSFYCRQLFSAVVPQAPTDRFDYYVEQEDWPAIETMLKNKELSPNATTLGGWSLLYTAVSGSYLPLVKIVLEAGADPNMLVTGVAITPTEMAREMGNQEIVDLLESYGGK